ncbi:MULTISPECIES: hypothetical protein [Streptomyces]|uniref:Uncharacterized protein n=1 Tax=Streptomyces venezuelae (strain ATCC 10712 / CBS 650.69 / DSM 40230 / JCM 4526 / NBRC 13096 / PD 04745) TaxID=953739 RepID=F2RL24_STRVP|nr:hypothetical protein [Streptomyces venezuelae]APE21392.1 hypothetical protein vnz_10400 [Streptomyces venezuelae]QER98783.1 hypothetical protein DEJ43_10540 [Streptomyces venezuelae ATCC 10712]CCA55413.1 hypothetical protein SVEN_2127 [Streptomyces venezuelae ATCC 10712]
MSVTTTADVQRALGFTDAQYIAWTAIHEIGHAVAGEAAGMKVRKIEINARKGRIHGGRVVCAPNHDIHANLVCAHGGHIAQDLWMRQYGLITSHRLSISRTSSRADLDKVAQYQPNPQAGIQAEDDARRLLGASWPRVIRATNVLMAEAKLSGRQLARIR